ncbi:helix-turn-helix domain-containing protein [Micromonospora craterilacus]|uniref:helix-turn-helix domain-containing protein n=1 Tax=Micromonospora craterilacus TaxID=1655439 RepID=UPI001F335A90|nr:helix-turn-helix domain-containing protein [Micromonospora craterilacus]
MSRGTAPARFSSPHADNFTGFARVVELGVSRLISFRYPAIEMARTERMIRQDDPQMYELALPLTGDSALIQERRQCVVKTTEFTFLSTSRPYECRHFPRQEAPTTAASAAAQPPTSKTIAVLVPQSAIPLPQSKVKQLLARPLPTEGMASLLAQFLLQITTHPERFRATDAGRLDGMALDLISATLAQHLDLESALPVEVQQQALRARIDAFIEQHLGDVDLSARTIAAAHHISVRTLYRLWEGEDTTVTDLIRRRRLDRCRRDLQNPLLASQSIYAIAARWGLTEKSTFARLFKATYGTSPQSYRQQQPAPGPQR